MQCLKTRYSLPLFCNKRDFLVYQEEFLSFQFHICNVRSYNCPNPAVPSFGLLWNWWDQVRQSTPADHCAVLGSFSKLLNRFEIDSTKISSRTFTDFSKIERVGLYTVILRLYSSTKNTSNKQLFSYALKLKSSWEAPLWLDCVVRLKGVTKHIKPVYMCKSHLLTALFKTGISSSCEAEKVLLYLFFFFFVEECLFVLVRGETSCRRRKYIC